MVRDQLGLAEAFASTKLSRNERLVPEVKWCRFEKFLQELEAADAAGRRLILC